MEKIFKYLEFLLPIHNCVTIPDLGGFIINLESAFSRAEPHLLLPKATVTFNEELTHNDGILISYLMKDESLSSNVALQKIKESVKILKKDLQAGLIIKCGSLGEISLNDEGLLLFVFNSSYIHPNFYGLTQVGLKRFIDIDKNSHKERKNTILRYTTGSVAAIAVSVLLFITPSTHIGEQSNAASFQEAGFINTLTESLNVSAPKADSCLVNLEVTNKENTTVNVISKKTYYIVVGGEDSKSRAKRLLEKIRLSGFNNAAIVESGGRYRVYVASFTNKLSGESFLNSFRNRNPKYESAWLYAQRN